MEFAGMKLVTILLFVVTYALIIAFYHRKTLVTGMSVIILLALGTLSGTEALQAINWNVILLYVGMLFLSEGFLYSKMPDYIAVKIATRSKSVAMALLLVCAFTGFISIFLENVAAVLIVAPIALAIARELKTSPVPMFIGMAISSNLQGAATLIGDPPSMLLGSFAKMNFNDFFFIAGKPSIFFAIELGALASLIVLYLAFRHHRQPVPRFSEICVVSRVPSLLIVALITALSLASFVETGADYLTGLLCLVFGIISLIWFMSQRKESLVPLIKRLDWSTALFLIFIFVLVQSLTIAGVITDIAQLIIGWSGQSLFAAFLIVVWMSVLFSAFVDNVPYLVAMLPVVQLIAQHLQSSPMVLFFGLLIGASVGGNITPVGASANVVAMGILKNKGYGGSFWQFVKIGLPFTLVSMIVASMFVWLVWS